MYTPAISPHDPSLMLLNCDMSAAYLSTDGGETWGMLHYDQLLSSTECKPVFHPIDPNVIYAASGWRGALAISRDRGMTWSKFSNGLPNGILEFAIDPGNPDLMLAGFNDGGYFSDDAGRSWDRCEGLPGPIMGLHMDLTSSRSSRRCFAGTNRGVYKSEDGGGSWIEVSSGLPWRSVQAFSGGSDEKAGVCMLYCSIESRYVEGEYAGGIYRSDDRGEIWKGAMGEGIGKGQPLPQYRYLLATNIQPLTVYASTSSEGRIFRSDDGGRRWRPIMFRTRVSGKLNVEPDYIIAETGGWEENISGMNVNPIDPDHVIVTNWMACNTSRVGVGLGAPRTPGARLARERLVCEELQALPPP